MSELLHESFSSVNLPYTVLLLLVFLYWAMYIVGAVGSDTLEAIGLDFDLDADAGSDVDADADMAHGGGGFLAAVLGFFHVGEVPIIVVLSILILALWTFSVTANYLLGNSSGWAAALLLIPNLLVGLTVTKAILKPLAPLLGRFFDQKGDRIELLGKRCLVRSLEVTPQHGQAEVVTRGAPLLLNVKCKEGDHLKQGEEAVIYDYDQEHNTYLIRKFDL